MKIVLDAMGGDLGPRPCIEGAIAASQRFNIEVILVGKERRIRRLMSKLKVDDARISVVNADDVVTMADKPRESLRKKNSSLAIATEIVRSGEGAALVSAANTGAVLAHSMFSWKLLPSIKKPAIATLLPTLHDKVVIIDSGAVVDCKPHHLVNFAIMGSTYAREVLGRVNPRVGLLSNGEEETKGNELVIEAHQILKKTGLNFLGNAEGRDIFTGDFDVITTDGFTGNVVLKTSEGLAKTITELLKREAMKSVATFVGGALMVPAVKALKRRTDYDEAGGAPLLGLNGVCIICHGSSNAKAIMNALRVAAESVSRNLVDHVRKDLERYHGHMKQAGVSQESISGDVAAPPKPATEA